LTRRPGLPYGDGRFRQPAQQAMDTTDTVADNLEAHAFGVVTGFPSPSRLSPATRHLGARYLSGETGRTLKPAEFAIAPAFFLRLPTPNQEYAEAVRLIAEQTPLRILPEEKLAGAPVGRGVPLHREPRPAAVSHPAAGP
jgi:hypothetical protein